MRLPRLRRSRANPEAEMSILEHIAELRDRLVKGCLALVVATLVAGIWLYDPVVKFLTRAYCEVPAARRFSTAAGGCKLVALSPLEPLGMRIRVSLTVGLVLAMPVIAFQLWRFITPGLKRNEKRYAIPFSLASGLLFASGVWVAFFTLPKAIDFLTSMGGDSLASFFEAQRYMRFVLFMGLAFGLTFEFPLIMLFLSMAGIVSSHAMLKAWRPAIALIVVAAAVITPSQDPISLFSMAVPLWIFYFAVAGIARFVIEPARARRQAQLLRPSE